MLKRILNWLIGLPLALAAIAFSIANRQWILVSFDPFSRDQPYASITMPLWVLFFCGIFVGLIAGWIAAWFAQGKWRKAAKEARIELYRTQSELTRQHQEAARRAVVPAADASL